MTENENEMCGPVSGPETGTRVATLSFVLAASSD